jgi:hypothetical protein
MTETSTFELKLNPYSLPSPTFNLSFRLTVWVSCLDSFNHISQFSRDHTEQKDYSLFVHRFMTPVASWQNDTEGKFSW